jgi:alkyl hydroperoxide reductase subunit AhpC
MLQQVFERVRHHNFHPLEQPGLTFTVDRASQDHGIADLASRDGRTRLLAVRDLVQMGTAGANDIARGLEDQALNVRVVSAAALGVLRADDAVEALEHMAVNDPQPVARIYAAIALGEMVSTRSLDVLAGLRDREEHRDVRHQCELAIGQIERGLGSTDAQIEAFRSLDAASFNSQEVGEPAMDFVLDDTEGRPWRRSEHDGSWTVLIWIFADWCPVCHNEFKELMDLRSAFADAGVCVATLENHDNWRGRVMVGKEIETALRKSREWLAQRYREGIWWPHLLDRAGAVGAAFGTDPMTFAVHGEYVNRPTTIILDPEGVIRFAYRGTFWGDRPSILETLDMIRAESFDFVHHRRLQSPA